MRKYNVIGHLHEQLTSTSASANISATSSGLNSILFAWAGEWVRKPQKTSIHTGTKRAALHIITSSAFSTLESVTALVFGSPTCIHPGKGSQLKR